LYSYSIIKRILRLLPLSPPLGEEQHFYSYFIIKIRCCSFPLGEEEKGLLPLCAGALTLRVGCYAEGRE
jgi:hypothetical protein